MSSKRVRKIETISGDEFVITPTQLVNIVDLYETVDGRRYVLRKDVAKFFKNPVVGEYGVGNNPHIKTLHNDAYCEALYVPTGHEVDYEIFISEGNHFNIGCMEFGEKETAIIRRWAKSYAKKSVTKSTTKVVGKKSSKKAA